MQNGCLLDMRHFPSQDPESGTSLRGFPFSGLGALSPHQLAGFGGSPFPKLPAGGSHPFIRSPGLGAPTPQISRTGELPLPIGGYHRLFGGLPPPKPPKPLSFGAPLSLQGLGDLGTQKPIPKGPAFGGALGEMLVGPYSHSRGNRSRTGPPQAASPPHFAITHLTGLVR